MISKNITYYKKPCVLTCDGRCDKAWGINNRPRLYFQENLVEPRMLVKGEEPRDWDDYVYVRDSALLVAPADPGTYECDHAKPSAVPLKDPSLMNKWCARECERSTVIEGNGSITIPDLENPQPNTPRREIKEEFLLRRSDGAYLTGDFETWSHDVENAHLFVRGAALNACIERWRGHYDLRVITIYEAQHRSPP